MFSEREYINLYNWILDLIINKNTEITDKICFMIKYRDIYFHYSTDINCTLPYSDDNQILQKMLHKMVEENKLRFLKVGDFHYYRLNDELIRDIKINKILV